MSSTYTQFLGLRKPENRDPETNDSWDIVLNNNADLIDAAFGERQYSAKAQAGTISANYPSGIQNSDSHSLSLNKVGEKLRDIMDLVPTAAEKASLGGGDNAYVKLNDIKGNKTLILSPEFEGGTIQASGSDNTGDLTVGSEIDGSNIRHNFYKWSSGEGTIQNYDIFVQVKIPDGWRSWRTDTAVALIIAIATEDTDAANSHVDITLQKNGQAAGVTLENQKSSVAEEWTNISISKADAVLLSVGAGDLLNVQITMNSLGSYVKIGAITLQYLGF